MESWGSRREDLSDVRPGVQGDRLVLGQVRVAPPDGRGAVTAGSGSDHRPDWNATASVAINPQQYRRIMPEPAGHQPRVNSGSDKLHGRKVTEIVEADMGQLLPITQSSEGARDAIWSPRLRVVNDLHQANASAASSTPSAAHRAFARAFCFLKTARVSGSRAKRRRFFVPGRRQHGNPAREDLDDARPAANAAVWAVGPWSLRRAVNGSGDLPVTCQSRVAANPPRP